VLVLEDLADARALLTVAGAAGLAVVGVGEPWPSVSFPPSVLVVGGDLGLSDRHCPWTSVRRVHRVGADILRGVRGVLADIASPDQRSADASPRKLAGEERLWLRELVAGSRVVDIACRAGFSEREMYRQLRRTYQMLGAATRGEAIAAAQRLGLLE
jgi:DNA-binding CsgD family transcriptional regulator